MAADVDEFTNSAGRISKARILEDFGSARDTGTEIMHGTHFSRMCIGHDGRAAKGVVIAAVGLP
jgi:hypothetical protein